MLPAETEREDVHQLWAEYKQTGSRRLRNRLMERYLSIVKYNAERISAKLPDEVENDDLVSAGVFGLMGAIDAYDLERGVKFETYCAARIRGAILDELRSMDWVPRLVRNRAHKLSQVMQELEAELGRVPTEEEMSARLGLPRGEFDKLLRDANASERGVAVAQALRIGLEPGRLRDRRAGGQARRRPGQRDPETRSETVDHPRAQPSRATDPDSVLLRRDDHEGDRGDARPLGIARVPDALLNPDPAQGAVAGQAEGTDSLSDCHRGAPVAFVAEGCGAGPAFPHSSVMSLKIEPFAAASPIS